MGFIEGWTRRIGEDGMGVGIGWRLDQCDEEEIMCMGFY